MSEENNDMVTVDETPKPEETKSTEDKRTPEPNEETKSETPKPTRVKITEVAKQKTVRWLSQDTFNEDAKVFSS